MIDDISMDYEGNRLVKTDDAVDGPYYAGAFHFVDRADEEVEYSYDANGNVTSDLNKNITRIDYNCLNLPTMIRFGDGSKYMSMKYDAAGRLLRRTTRVPFEDIAVSGKLQHERAKADLAALSSRFFARNGAAATATSTAGASSASSSASSSAPATTSQGASSSASSSGVRAAALSGNVFGMTDYDYCGNVEYTNDKAVLYHSEGYVTFDKNQQPEFHYYLKDHLGNIRVVVSERDSVEQVTHYYPFGGSFGDGVGSSVQDYLYSGKELTRFNALNWYNYGARWYDPATLRWNGVDELAEKYTPVSPYVYCLNNPVNAVDPDGRVVIPVHGTWSSPKTWKNLKSLADACKILFKDGKMGNLFMWESGNSSMQRILGATKLIGEVRKELSGKPQSEPITIVGHSHGGNVGILAINIMVGMDEFKDRQINLLTINTPVRDDYQLSDKAQTRVHHINVYDPKDPVQISGGKTPLLGEIPIIGEVGPAKRTFKNAKNIRVYNPQNVFGDFHNSHNRILDWIKKIL